MSTPFKVILGTVLVAVFIVYGYILLTQEKMLPQTSVAPQTTSEEILQETLAPEEAIATVSEPAPTASVEKLQELQAQVTAGTITPEEAMKQIDAFNNANTAPVQATQKQ